MSRMVDQKINLFVSMIAIAFIGLVARLYYLQVIQGEYYVQRSESNFIQERIIKHSRGKIIDSHGRVLADNRLSYDLYVTFALLPDSLKNLRLIANPLKWSKKELLEINTEIFQRAEQGISDELVIDNQLNRYQCLQLMDLARTQMISGVIFDYMGGDLCQLKISPSEFPRHQSAIERLASLVSIESKQFKNYWQRAQKKAQGLARFKPNLLMSDIGFDSYVRIENAISLGLLAGVSVVPGKRRRYVYDDVGTHVIGFLNQISLDELKKSQGKYRSGDYVGRRGIEATYEESLRGVDGIERVVVDAKGRRFNEAWEQGLLGQERIVEPVAGATVKLSIDLELQKAAQEYFQGISGSVVVMDVNTGFIKAMASFPTFDPNLMVSSDNTKAFKELLADKNRPFRNKAVQDHYSPGSTFKPITAIAGLSKQLITPSYEHYCSGNYRLHKVTWRCFKREGHGSINLFNALKASCDSYFYELGYRLGLDNLSQVASKLGFGSKTDIALVGETPGILPSKDYYKKRFGYVAPGNVVNMSIGQGDLNVSPLQLAVAYSAIANGGTVYQPQLVEQVIDDHGHVIKQMGPVIKSRVVDSSFDFSEIMNSLSYVAEPGGTAYGLRYDPRFSDIAAWLKENQFRVVGKTGTAQVVKLSKSVEHYMDVTKVPYEQRDHSWFVSFFPQDNPHIVVVVMTEHGGFGGSISGPVAVRISKKWHEQNNTVMMSQSGDQP